MRTALLRGMAGADVLGFQSKQWAENYLLSARSLPELRVLRGGRLDIDGRLGAVRSFPVAVSAEPLRETANSARGRRGAGRAAGPGPVISKLMLRVDRLEPSKNILRGFLAYELFLRRNPSWVGSVRFLCLFSPSREDVPEYQNYGEECLAEAERINAELGTKAWKPIEVRVQEDYAFAVAAYDLYDVLFVNPTYDGMNLVAMEGPLVNRRDGVLVLSRNAGAFSRLGRQSLGVNPFDLAETAEAIREALEMPDEERAREGPWALTHGAGTHAGELAGRPVGSGRPDPSAVAAPRLSRDSQPAEQGDQPGGAVDDDVGRVGQRHGRLPAVHRDLQGAHPALGESVERLERPDVCHVVARVEHGVEPLLVDDAIDRAFLQRPAGRHELEHHLAGQQLEVGVVRDRRQRLEQAGMGGDRVFRGPEVHGDGPALRLDPRARDRGRRGSHRVDQLPGKRRSVLGEPVEGGQPHALDADQLTELVAGATRHDRDDGIAPDQSSDRVASPVADARELGPGHDRAERAVEVEQHAGAPFMAAERGERIHRSNPSVRGARVYTRHP